MEIGIQSLPLQLRDEHILCTLSGQSVAGLRTCLMISEWNLCFDMGMFPTSSTKLGVVAITHGHADHCSALHSHSFQRGLTKLPRPTYYLPSTYVSSFHNAYDAFRCLNKNITPQQQQQHYNNNHNQKHQNRRNQFNNHNQNNNQYYPSNKEEQKNIQSNRNNINNNKKNSDRHYEVITSGELKLQSGSLVLKAYPTLHRVPSQGYVVFRDSMKLKVEYKDKKGEELKTLRKSGVEISEASRVPLLAFTGDSTMEGVLSHEDMLNAKVLIIECTFLNTNDSNINNSNNNNNNLNASSSSSSSSSLSSSSSCCSSYKDNNDNNSSETQSFAHEKGHIHELDFIIHHSKFKNELIVLTHLSQRYKREEI